MYYYLVVYRKSCFTEVKPRRAHKLNISKHISSVTSTKELKHLFYINFVKTRGEIIDILANTVDDIIKVLRPQSI